MNKQQDPFDEYRGEVEVALKQLTSLRNAMQSSIGVDLSEYNSGSVGRPHLNVDEELRKFDGQINRFEESYAEIEDDAILLQDLITSLKNAKAAGPTTSSKGGTIHNESILTEREQFVANAKKKLADHENFIQTIKTQHQRREDELAHDNPALRRRMKEKYKAHSNRTSTAMNIDDRNSPGGGGSGGGRNYGDGSDLDVEDYEMEQGDLRKEQDQVLDSLANGVTILRMKATAVHDEIVTHDTMLEEIEHDVDTLHGKVLAANAKVNTMLNQMSNKWKTLIIIFLCFVLGMLIAYVAIPT